MLYIINVEVLPMKKNKAENDLLTSIEDLRKEMSIVKSRFDMETDECLIDSYIYQMEALNKKYQYFLKQAKKTGVKANVFVGGCELCSRLL